VARLRRIFLAGTCVALASLTLVGGARASATPLEGLYQGKDSAGGRIAFRVSAAPPGSGLAGTQYASFRRAGSYSSICTPVGLVFGPLLGAGCKAGPFPDPPLPDLPLVFAETNLKAVYADPTVDDENDAVFNGTVGGATQTYSTESGEKRTDPYPQLTWRAVLVDPAAVATPIPGRIRIAGDAARVAVRCQARGLPACSGTLELSGGGLGPPVTAHFRLPDGARRIVSVRLPARAARSLASSGGATRFSARVVSSNPRTRTTHRRAGVFVSGG